jgi:hypothetical protein
MGVLRKSIVVSIAIIMLVLGLLYFYSLSQVSVRQVNINGLSDVGLRGFTVTGNIDVHNGGILPVYVDEINYDVILEESNEKLTQGHIKGGWILPNQVEPYYFSNKINWKPAASVVVRMMRPGGNTYALIKGELSVADFSIVEFKVPFEKRFDIEVHIRQFVVNTIKEKTREVVTNVKDTTDDLIEGAKNAGSKIIEGVENLFN